MVVLHVIALAIYAFGTYVCASVVFSMVRAGRGEGDDRPVSLGRAFGAACRTPALRWNFVLLVLCGVWFGLHLVRELFPPSEARRWLDLVRLDLSLLFPPLLIATTYHELRERGALSRSTWRYGIVLSWIVSSLFAVYVTLAVFRVVPRPESLGPVIGAGFALAYAIAGVYCALALSIGRKQRETSGERKSRLSQVTLYGVLLLFAGLVAIASVGRLPIEQLLNLVGGSLPLFFIFTAAYHENRFEFVDLLVKRGLFFVTCLLLLVASFGVVLPALDWIARGAERPWILALFLLPLALLLPWIHRRLGRWLDNVWLGRLFPPVVAIKRFLGGLRDAVTREQLVEQAERGLAAIFHAPSRVLLGSSKHEAAPFEAAIEVPVRSAGEVVGTIQMGPRANHMPYFGEDRMLIGSLADVLSHMLENVDLQARRQEQEARAHELSLAASRSELKALRAQINPHFLFNALNAIAGLIHKDPSRADETLEQLAEVFRYTLRGSDSEWVALSEELDFVRSYLEVERARFGQRLEIAVSAPADVAAARVPTMLVQTLVENAVKHGVAVVRGPARIEVRARAEGGSLVVEVLDSGPGFSADAPAGAKAPAATRQSGYGLRNVRERLAGHYGARARLDVSRDEERGLTVVALVLPAARTSQGAA